MPIKFRCAHCRQLLGIARSKAGEVFDCPTCGRTIRVPQLDGTVQPLPAPALDFLDPALAGALDQLATWERGDEAVADDSRFAEASTAQSPPGVKPLAPAPAAVPIAVEPPLPAQAVIPASASAPPASGSGLDDLIRLPVEAGQGRATPSWRTSSRTAGQRLRLLAVVGCVGVAGFLGGFLAGRMTEPGRSDSTAESKDHAIRVGGPSNDVDLTPEHAAVAGRITWMTTAGDRRPDRGARVILLPQHREGEPQLPTAGFLAAATETDVQATRAALRAAGGDLAIADSGGEFTAALPAAGDYHLLVLSHFQSRPLNEPIDAAAQRILQNWFERPERMLGRVGYRFDQVRYDGRQPALFDYTFARQP